MSARLLLPVIFFLGLGSLEVVSAVEKLRSHRDEKERDLLDFVDREQEGLGRILEERLGEGNRHAAHLARTPFVRALLRDPSEPNRALARDLLLPYLASFAEIDRICLLDPSGYEVYRCERMTTGIAALPDDLLATSPQGEILDLARGASPGQVSVSRLMHDRARVEVAEADRLIFHYVTAVEDRGALGLVVVTVYAAPILHALSEFVPIPGITSCLLDPEGRLFSPGPPTVPHSPERVESLLDADTLAPILQGTARIRREDAVLLSRPTGSQPASLVVSAVPLDSLRLATGALGKEALRTGMRTLLVLAAIALGSAYFVRTSLRATRLRETERYLVRIREESDKLRALMEAAADMILIVEADGEKLRDSNPLARDVLGLDAAQDSALTSLEESLEGDGAARLRAGMASAAGELGVAHNVPGLHLRSRSGELLDLDARCIALAYGGEQLIEVCLTDRTREREMERRARVTERMSSLGLLTAGVAHEINNPLEGIGNYLSLLENPESTAESRKRYLERLRTGFDRIRDIVGDLLHFARSDGGTGRADLASVVDRAVSMARWSPRLRQASIVVEGLDPPFSVPGSEGKLEQVLLNLLLNAGQAIQGSGNIRIAAVKDSSWAELSVEDDGPGIDEAHLERIFEPFFTGTGGTGLGLAVSYGILQSHGGELLAENRPGGGARFRLRLPLEDHGAPSGSEATDGPT